MLKIFAGYDVTLVKEEKELFQKLVQLVRASDPDVLLGFTVHNASWGYLVERATLAFNWNLCNLLSRLKLKEEHRKQAPPEKEAQPWRQRLQNSLSSMGRLFLTVRRSMKSELAVTSYTLENFVYHILHQR
jgi:DNA polymerase zeta